MSALLLQHRAALCRKHSRALLWTLSRRNSHLLANKSASSSSVNNVLSRWDSVTEMLLSKSVRTLTSQPQRVIQVRQEKEEQSISKREKFGLCPFLVVITVSDVSTWCEYSLLWTIYYEKNKDEILIQSYSSLLAPYYNKCEEQPPAFTLIVEAFGCVSMSVAKMISTNFCLTLDHSLLLLHCCRTWQLIEYYQSYIMAKWNIHITEAGLLFFLDKLCDKKAS